MRTCPRKAGFITLKSATNLIHFSWSKTAEKGEKEEEVQTDQGAGNDNAMGVLLSPEDREALDEQLEGSIDDEEGDMRPLNLDFGDADVDVNGDDGDDDDAFEDAPEKFDPTSKWTRAVFIQQIIAQEGYNRLFKGYSNTEDILAEKKKNQNGLSAKLHHFNLNVLRQHWKENYGFSKDKPALSPHQMQQQKKERTDINTWHNFKWSEAEQVVNLNINGANNRTCKITQPYMVNAGPAKKFMTWYNEGKQVAMPKHDGNKYFRIPVDIFERVFPRRLVQAITKSTNCNIRLTQNGQRFYIGVSASLPQRKPPKTDAQGRKKPWEAMLVTEAEIMKYIALSMHAGWNRRPQMKMLWAQDYGSKFMIDSGMSYERWQEINEFIHIGLEDGYPNLYKMDKMRKLVVECNKIWSEQWNCGPTSAMDEKTYPSTCKHPFGFRAWYHPNKPHKNGPQSYALCSAGYTLFNWMKFDNCECRIKVRDVRGKVQTQKVNSKRNKKGDVKFYNSTENRWHEDDCNCQCVPWKTNWSKFKAHLIRKGINYTEHTKLQLTILYMVYTVDPKENWRTLVMDNFFTSVKMASALLKMGWSMVGTIAKGRNNSGIPLEGDAQQFRKTIWKEGAVVLKIHEGELGHTQKNEKEMDMLRTENDLDKKNLCYVNKEGCFAYGFIGESGKHFHMISTKPLTHGLVTKTLRGRQLYYAQANSHPTTKEITEMQHFYNTYMGDVDIADQFALAYSKEDYTRSRRWVNVIFTWYFDTARVNAYVLHRRAAQSQRHYGQEHAANPLTHLEFIKSVCEGYMQRAKEIELKAQQPRLRPQCPSVVVDSITTATPSTKNTGKQSTKIMEENLRECVKYLKRINDRKTPRLQGTHFSFQHAKFDQVHWQVELSKTTAQTKKRFRCHCCHIFQFGKKSNQKGNKVAKVVCECKEGPEHLNGACNKILYCDPCWKIRHDRELFLQNLGSVERWLEQQNDRKSTRSKASSCNASSSGTFRNISNTNKRLNFGNT